MTAQQGLNQPPLPIGIALGSGLARGFAHIGVLKALNRHGIMPTIVAGTSIGALVGGCYLAGKLQELEDWALALNRRKVFGYLDFRVRSAGLIGGNRLTSTLEHYFKDTQIENLPHPFIAIASDIATGHEVWLRKGNLIDAMRASFALPGVFPPVDVNNRLLVDGALINPVPVSPCLALGSRMTIAVDLNADLIGKATKPGQRYQTVAGFDIFSNDVDPADQQIFSGGLTKRIFRREQNNPSLFGVMVSALNIMQDRLTRSRLAGDPPDVHIKPQISHIGLLEFERAQEMIHEGEAAVERAMPDIRAALKVMMPMNMRDAATDSTPGDPKK
ncbi:MAG: patatin-like phospholipase family protein [Alphaproteobacteria bacterium]|nr:patatin-like phospholipase family protein [Alphaproteobacteria bacterium]MBU0859779.1 patatin-like phospholipase family protein [Alphaproteobacteria bacterium]